MSAPFLSLSSSIYFYLHFPFNVFTVRPNHLNPPIAAVACTSCGASLQKSTRITYSFDIIDSETLNVFEWFNTYHNSYNTISFDWKLQNLAHLSVLTSFSYTWSWSTSVNPRPNYEYTQAVLKNETGRMSSALSTAFYAGF